MEDSFEVIQQLDDAKSRFLLEKVSLFLFANSGVQ